jgi:integrase/recombinase XerD
MAKHRDFVPSHGKAKTHIVAHIVRLARRERLSYTDFLYVCQQARKQLGLRKPQNTRTLPQLLPASALQRFFQVIEACGNLQHEIMLKLLFYTAVRVSELVRIRTSDVDVEQCKIFIAPGKGRQDRYILFPTGFPLVLKTYRHAYPQNHDLFESQRGTPFTTRRIQQIVQMYRQHAGIDQVVHPHLFRHQMLTYLTARGLSDAQLQLSSGYKRKQSLEVYQHISLEMVEEAYQAAVQSLRISWLLCPW